MYKYLKPGLDIIFASIFLILLSPLMAAIALLLLFQKQGVFFIQQRQGYQGKLFQIIKFKTMADLRDPHGNLLDDQARITQTGLFLRKYHLDELPQLFNIIKGELSFIGPRPLLPEYDVLYSIEQKRRFTVKPGITGWAQVNGGNSISWREKLNYDIWYIQNHSLRLDLFIIYKTLKAFFLLRGEGKPLWAVEKFDGKN